MTCTPPPRCFALVSRDVATPTPAPHAGCQRCRWASLALAFWRAQLATPAAVDGRLEARQRLKACSLQLRMPKRRRLRAVSPIPLPRVTSASVSPPFSTHDPPHFHPLRNPRPHSKKHSMLMFSACHVCNQRCSCSVIYYNIRPIHPPN